jgi:hypothetical protein
MTDVTPSQATVFSPAAETKGAAVKNSPDFRGLPAARGLYDPRNEHDACGVGFIAQMKGVKSHQIVKDGLFMLENLTHRGAVGADPLMGDGAGVLVQIPDAFFREEIRRWRWCTSASRPTPSRVAAGAPLPLHRGAQRRDQHRARQRQLDARARGVMKSPLLGADLKKLWPIRSRRPVRHRHLRQRARTAVHGRLPAGARDDDADPRGLGRQPLMDAERRRAFYEYHAAMMEPWDGPAAIAFTDGRQIGATLDRNGLRPARYSSPTTTWSSWPPNPACCRSPRDKIVRKWRLQPGKMFLIDLEQGRIIDDEELKASSLANAKPYKEWLENACASSSRTSRPVEPVRPGAPTHSQPARSPAGLRLHAGRHQVPERPMATTGEEPSARWATTPDGRAVGQEQAAVQLLQAELFAQVTNPPIDPIREELVMSLVSFIGPRPNLLDHQRGNAGRTSAWK